jgi:predicted nucleic acid-binding protein
VNGFLVDTNIPSELTRPRPEPLVAEFLKAAGKERVYVSVLTLGEICKGIAGLPASARRTDLQNWLDTVMRPWFAGRVLPITASIAERWGFLAGDAKLRGTPLSVVDGLLAATALQHDLTVVSRNVRDFSGLGVTLLDPWTDAP